MMKPICALDDIPDGEARAFPLPGSNSTRFIIVRCADKVWGYINLCPHMGVELQWEDGRFMSLDGCQLQCSMHGALFNIDNGHCTWGPCQGRALSRVELELRDGHIYRLEPQPDA